MPSANPKLLNLNQDHSSKKQFFCSNHYKIEVMITPLIEVLELLNFGLMTASIIWFESRDKILLVTSWIIYDVINFISKTFVLRRSRVAVFADIITISTTFIKKIFKYWRKVKRIKICLSKCNLYLYFLMCQSFSFPVKHVSRLHGVCPVIHIFFGSSLGKG